jgi:adenylate cyclase
VRRFSLAQILLVATLAVAGTVAASTTAFLRASRASRRETSDRMRVAAAARVQQKVVGELGKAQKALDDIESGLRSGAIRADDLALLEAHLYGRLLAEPRLEEATFSRATQEGFDDEGEARLAPEGRWQLSVFRTAEGLVHTRLVQREAGGFVARRRARPAGLEFLSAPLEPAGSAADPTAHATFSVLASRGRRGRAIWSDLHHSELDQSLPPGRRRAVVSVQKAIEGGSGGLLGVLRVGMQTSDLDAIAHQKVDEGAAEDPHVVALMVVDEGPSIHLVARVDPSDHLEVVGDDLRIVSDHPPPAIASFLSSPLAMGLDPDHPGGDGVISVGGEPYLATLQEISLGRGGTSGWFAAILVPEAHYTRDLVRLERTLLALFSGAILLLVAIGALAIGAMRRGLGRVVTTTARMRAFDFSPGHDSSVFRDVNEVILGLERAKTVVRAMGKYIPIDLVRRLYDDNREPSLGGELAEVSILFSDLEGFTTLSEKLSPGELARRLGDYLEALTGAIERSGGTIDKYVGDAVMALWNVPTPVEGQARRACRAALDCMAAARALYASPKWVGLPPLVTRFGLHQAEVMVGNFGAPTRLSYTVLGDGVNLAARLEPLCKQYGVVALVSEVIEREARDEFVFRRIDRVAVKGKSQGIDVFELLGARGDEIPALPLARRYEEAFEAYLDSRFTEAIALLEPQQETDRPSAVLLARCRELAARPAPEGWDGVHRATSK